MKLENINKAKDFFEERENLIRRIKELENAVEYKSPNKVSEEIYVGTYNVYIDNIFISTALNNYIDGLKIQLNILDNKIEKL